MIDFNWGCGLGVRFVDASHFDLASKSPRYAVRLIVRCRQAVSSSGYQVYSRKGNSTYNIRLIFQQRAVQPGCYLFSHWGLTQTKQGNKNRLFMRVNRRFACRSAPCNVAGNAMSRGRGTLPYKRSVVPVAFRANFGEVPSTQVRSDISLLYTK